MSGRNRKGPMPLPTSASFTEDTVSDKRKMVHKELLAKSNQLNQKTAAGGRQFNNFTRQASAPVAQEEQDTEYLEPTRRRVSGCESPQRDYELVDDLIGDKPAARDRLHMPLPPLPNNQNEAGKPLPMKKPEVRKPKEEVATLSFAKAAKPLPQPPEETAGNRSSCESSSSGVRNRDSNSSCYSGGSTGSCGERGWDPYYLNEARLRRESLIGRDRDRYMKEEPWFSGSADRAYCEQRVFNQSQDGGFVVRASRKEELYPYSITVLYRSHVYHLRIRSRPDGKYSLGAEKPNENIFDSVTDMISFHMNNPIKLISDQTRDVPNALVKLVCPPRTSS